MIVKLTVADQIRHILDDYTASDGGSMDPILNNIIEIINDRIIGLDEQSGESDAVIRNEMRRLQRNILVTDDDSSIKLPIALCLDDYKKYLYTPVDDHIVQLTANTITELIVDAIEKYLLPKGREVLAKTSHGPVEAALIPLFKRQLKELGIV